LVDVDRERGEQAHKLARKYGLKPTDSVHLACALRAKCDVLLSFDPDFVKLKEVVEDGHTIGLEVPDIIGQTTFLP
jgi:predicted nucleic acid-binding protein